MRTTKLILAPLAALLALAGSARADVVHLADGGRVEGAARRVGEEVVIAVDGGELRLPAAEVVRVERARGPLVQLRARRARLPARAISPRLALAAWALEHDLVAEARTLYREVLRLDPDNPAARRALEAQAREAPAPAPSPSLEQLVAERRAREAEADARRAQEAVQEAERRARAAEAAAVRAAAAAASGGGGWALPWSPVGVSLPGRARFPFPRAPGSLHLGLRTRVGAPGGQVLFGPNPAAPSTPRGPACP